MCKNLKKISEQNRYQWIGICAHDVAHIHWKTLQIGISRSTLNTLVKQALTSSHPVEKQGESYLLWLEQAALKLSEQDYHDFIYLLADANINGSNPASSALLIKRQSRPPAIH